MEKKSKYSLFPTKPSPSPREPLPPLLEADDQPRPCEEPPLIQQTSPTPHESPPHSPQQAPTSPQEEPLYPWPPLNNSWSSREDSTSTLKGISPPRQATRAETKMHSPSSSTSSECSLHKPTSTSPPEPAPNLRNRPKTVYFHSGIGGAGNYHKAIREDNVLRRMAANRSNQPRFLSSIFGSLGGKRGKRQQQQQYSGGEGTGSSQSSRDALPLGAAEVMRRKMLGFGADVKAKEHGSRG